MTKDEFFALGWSEKVANQLNDLIKEGKAKAFSATRTPEGQLKARVWAQLPAEWDSDKVYVFGEPEPSVIEAPGPTAYSRTQQALRLIDNGWSAYRACKFVGLSQAAVSRARKRRENRTSCPHCGQLMKS
jgi:hypothetical protein